MKLVRLDTQNREQFAQEIAQAAQHDRLAFVCGSNTGPRDSIALPVGGFWLPLWGRAQYDPGNAQATLGAGELYVSAGAGTIGCASNRGCLWLALLASQDFWRHALSKICRFPVPDPVLLGGTYGSDRMLRRDAVHLIRYVNEAPPAQALEAALALVAGLQHELEAAIARCPGRSYSQRRQVFVRLQRVRSYIAANCDREIDSAHLARVANFSTSYFIRAFHAVFDETPHTYLLRRRLQRARSMLSTTPLSITEIAIACGFDNRSSFARIFRKHFGSTAIAVRRWMSELKSSDLQSESAIFARSLSRFREAAAVTIS